jgi:hypothetical protein
LLHYSLKCLWPKTQGSSYILVCNCYIKSHFDYKFTTWTLFRIPVESMSYLMLLAATAPIPCFYSCHVLPIL